MALSCDYLLAVLFIIQEVGSTRAPVDSGLILDEKKGREAQHETAMMIGLAILSAAYIGSARPIPIRAAEDGPGGDIFCNITFGSPPSASFDQRRFLLSPLHLIFMFFLERLISPCSVSFFFFCY